MKKLLAIVLCIMLFAGVIPTSAFADIDLSPAYARLEVLNNAYAQLATAVACRNAYDGCVDMGDYFGADSFAGAKAFEEANWWAGNAQNIVNVVANTHVGMSYEGLFELVAPDVYISYENVGQQIINDVAAEYARIEANMIQAINDQVAAMFPW